MYKNILSNYDKIAATFAKSRKNMRWQEIDYFLEKFFSVSEKKTVKILDIGCGSGRLLDFFGEKGYLDQIEYLGIDESKQMILEAQKNYPDKRFEVLEMQNLDKLGYEKFDYVFFVASFHHQKFLRERIQTLKKLTTVLEKNATIFMTNWALQSKKNKEKYKNSKIIFSKADFEKQEDFFEKQKEKSFGSGDFSIKIGDFFRYYHAFTLEELDFLFSNTGYKVLENRLFENQKNFISILQKKI